MLTLLKLAFAIACARSKRLEKKSYSGEWKVWLWRREAENIESKPSTKTLHKFLRIVKLAVKISIPMSKIWLACHSNGSHALFVSNKPNHSKVVKLHKIIIDCLYIPNISRLLSLLYWLCSVYRAKLVYCLLDIYQALLWYKFQMGIFLREKATHQAERYEQTSTMVSRF